MSAEKNISRCPADVPKQRTRRALGGNGQNSRGETQEQSLEQRTENPRGAMRLWLQEQQQPAQEERRQLMRLEGTVAVNGNAPTAVGRSPFLCCNPRSKKRPRTYQ